MEKKFDFVVLFFLQVVVLMVSIFHPVPADLETFFESSPLLLLFVAFGRLLEHIAKVTMYRYSCISVCKSFNSFNLKSFVNVST